MNLVDNVHLILSAGGTVSHLLADLTDIIDAVVGSGVDLYHIHGRARLDGAARLTFIARTAVFRMLTVDCLCEDLRHCGLSGSSRSAEEVRMSDAVCLHLILQCCHNVFLSLDVLKSVRAELTV